MRRRPRRVLAIDPISRGFGFAVFEGGRLVDWGLRHIREDKERRMIEKVSDLIQLYRPDRLVVEDCAAPGCRRGPRVRALTAAVCGATEVLGVRCRRVPRTVVRGTFPGKAAITKHEVAAAIAHRFPELAPLLPRRRKIWQSEDERMAVFDAAALSVTVIAGR